MRLRAAVAASMLLALSLLLAAPARAVNAHPAECARLARQIDHFEGMQQRAQQLGNAMWVERTQQHVALLREQQKERCPDDASDHAAKQAWYAFMNLLKMAGKAALTYFTFGAM